MSADKFQQLETLIGRYEEAIFDPTPDPKKIDTLCQQVEAEAHRVGYTNHKRLLAMHSMAEQVCGNSGVGRDGDEFEQEGEQGQSRAPSR